MGLTYFKRYRMELNLAEWHMPRPRVPVGYHLISWDRSILNAHAEVKFLSFRDEIDANVFSCFHDLASCRRLMRDIAGRHGFLPEATWLAVYCPDEGDPMSCGTIQGVRDKIGIGSIQNLGIIPNHRSRQLGTHLLHRALTGFCRRGLTRVRLEVTADNDGAIRFYRRMGFRPVKTVFKAVEVVYS